MFNRQRQESGCCVGEEVKCRCYFS